MSKAVAKSAVRAKVSTRRAPLPGYLAWVLAPGLALLSVWVFWPATRCGFVNFDDPEYVTENPSIQAGLSWHSVEWAFQSGHAGNWHPLTWISHIVDWQLYGLNPWGHHLSSVLLHALNAALVFGLLRQMTGATWRSFFVATLFALHPLRVESVAWVAERKDVLCGFFGLLSLWLYARYAQKRALSPRPRDRSVSIGALGSYVGSFFFFALGLMSKPMLVTWPFLMLLLDVWPLDRLRSPLHTPQPAVGRSLVARCGSLMIEKIPFLVAALVVSLVTYGVQKQGGAISAGEAVSLGHRGANALLSCCRYLARTLWPTDLAAFYPMPDQWSVLLPVLAGLVMVGLSVRFLVLRRHQPFLLVGWLWFLGTLVPVIGLVPLGWESMADRYTYLPTIGLLLALVWSASHVAQRWQHGITTSSLAGVALIAMCAGLTRHQIEYWRDSETLFRHALAVTKNNYLAHNNLGAALEQAGESDQAMAHFEEAMRLKPDYAQAHFNLGTVLLRRGRLDEAVFQLQEATRFKPGYAEAHHNLGGALDLKGQVSDAVLQLQEAVRLAPDQAPARSYLAAVLLKQGRVDEAIAQCEQALLLNPKDAPTRNNLGALFIEKGDIDSAIVHLREALHLKTDYEDAHLNLGIALLKQEQTEAATREFEECLRLNPNNPRARDRLAQALESRRNSTNP